MTTKLLSAMCSGADCQSHLPENSAHDRGVFCNKAGLSLPSDCAPTHICPPGDITFAYHRFGPTSPPPSASTTPPPVIFIMGYTGSMYIWPVPVLEVGYDVWTALLDFNIAYSFTVGRDPKSAPFLGQDSG